MIPCIPLYLAASDEEEEKEDQREVQKKKMDDKISTMKSKEIKEIFKKHSLNIYVINLKNGYVKSWRQDVYCNRPNDENLKRHHLQYCTIGKAGFSYWPLKTIDRLIDESLNITAKSITNQYIRYKSLVLFPEVMIKIMQIIFTCDHASAESYCEEAGESNYEKKKRKKNKRFVNIIFLLLIPVPKAIPFGLITF